MVALPNQNNVTRGGYRQGSGRKGQWKTGATKAVKLPVALIPKLVEIAKVLDEGGEVLEVVTNPTASTPPPTARRIRVAVGELVEYAGVVAKIAAWKPESRLVQLEIGNRVLPNLVSVAALKPVRQ